MSTTPTPTPASTPAPVVHCSVECCPNPGAPCPAVPGFPDGCGAGHCPAHPHTSDHSEHRVWAQWVTSQMVTRRLRLDPGGRFDTDTDDPFTPLERSPRSIRQRRVVCEDCNRFLVVGIDIPPDDQMLAAPDGGWAVWRPPMVLGHVNETEAYRPDDLCDPASCGCGTSPATVLPSS